MRGIFYVRKNVLVENGMLLAYFVERGVEHSHVALDDTYGNGDGFVAGLFDGNGVVAIGEALYLKVSPCGCFLYQRLFGFLWILRYKGSGYSLNALTADRIGNVRC